MNKKATPKTTKKASVQITAPTAGCANFGNSMTALELTHQFIQTKRQVRKYNEDFQYLDCLAHSLGLLSANRQDFNQSQFLVLTRAFHEAESETTRALLNLFEEWLAFMRLNRKIRTEFVIDEPTHRWT